MPGLLRRAASGAGSLLDSATDWVGDTATDAYNGVTGFNFEGRDARNARMGTPTLDELTAEDSPWREMSAGETIYHDNNDAHPERKFIRDDPDSFLGLGGYEYVHDGATNAPMEPGALQATYNYINPAEGGMGDLSPEGIFRNVGHVVADVIPYILGGTVRGDEGNNMLERAVGPANYESITNTVGGIGDSISSGWDSVTGWASDTASSVGSGISDAWETGSNFVSDTASSIGSSVSSGIDSATSWASDTASSVGDGISSGLDWAGNAASSAGGAIASFFSW